MNAMTTKFFDGAKIDRSQISSVYSSKANTCCCGCAGNHRYATAHRDAAGKARGYAVGDDEVSDRSIKIVCGKIEAAIASGTTPEVTNGFVSCDVGGRTLIAYCRE